MAEDHSLAGRRIAITRARAQAADLREALERRGARVIELPTIEIRDPSSWQALDDAIRRLDEFDFLLVTSVNGVKQFLRRMHASGRDLSSLQRLEVGAIGPATAAALSKAGVGVSFVPDRYQAEGLLDALQERNLQGKRFLIPRAKIARDLVPRTLRERGAEVEVVEAYETVAAKLSPGELQRLLTPRPDAITFTSSSTASYFAQLMQARRQHEMLAGVAVASIGPVTSATLRKLGLQVAVEAHESTMAGLVEALSRYFSLGAAKML